MILCFGGAKEGVIVTNQGIHSKALFETDRFMPFSRIDKIHAQKTKLFINDFPNWEGNIIDSAVLHQLCQMVNQLLIKAEKSPRQSVSNQEKPAVNFAESENQATSTQYGLVVLKSDVAFNKIMSNARVDTALDVGLSLIFGGNDSGLEKLQNRLLFLVTSTLKDFRKKIVENSGLMIFKNDYSTYDTCSLIYCYTLIQILLQTKDETLCENLLTNTFRDKVFTYLRAPQKQSNFTKTLATRFDLYVSAISEGQLTVIFLMSLMSSNESERFSTVDSIVQIYEDKNKVIQLELLMENHAEEIKGFMKRFEDDVREFSKHVVDYKYSNA